jgi:hypothetical protein
MHAAGPLTLDQRELTMTMRPALQIIDFMNKFGARSLLPVRAAVAAARQHQTILSAAG